MRKKGSSAFFVILTSVLCLTACDGTVNLTGSVPYTEGNIKTAEESTEEISETEEISSESDEETTETVDTSEIPKYAVELDGHSYYIYNGDWEDISSYSEAAEFCEEKGGYMASISSDEENDFLFKYVQDEGYTSAYFGYVYNLDSNKWENSHDTSETYTNWGVDQPDGTGQNFYAKFASAAADGTWANDSFGQASDESNVKMFLCEWDGVKDSSDDSDSSEDTSDDNESSEDSSDSDE